VITSLSRSPVASPSEYLGLVAYERELTGAIKKEEELTI
jgi:hypothetical protein